MQQCVFSHHRHHQSAAVRRGVTKLVLHSAGVRRAVAAGAAVGVSTLHYDGEIRQCVERYVDEFRRRLKD